MEYPVNKIDSGVSLETTDLSSPNVGLTNGGSTVSTADGTGLTTAFNSTFSSPVITGNSTSHTSASTSSHVSRRGSIKLSHLEAPQVGLPSGLVFNQNVDDGSNIIPMDDFMATIDAIAADPSLGISTELVEPVTSEQLNKLCSKFDLPPIVFFEPVVEPPKQVVSVVQQTTTEDRSRKRCAETLPDPAISAKRRECSPGKRVVQRNYVELTEESICRNPDKKLSHLGHYRHPNKYNIDCFAPNGQQPEGYWNYECNTLVKEGGYTNYTPMVCRYRKADEALKQSRSKAVVAREGLCPFCKSDDPDDLFYDVNSSHYSAHLLTCHGIFTTGKSILDPVVHTYGMEHKGNGSLRETECVVCPYEDCGEVLKLSKQNNKDAHTPERLSAYIRHVSQAHKDRKNRINSRRRFA